MKIFCCSSGVVVLDGSRVVDFRPFEDLKRKLDEIEAGIPPEVEEMRRKHPGAEYDPSPAPVRADLLAPDPESFVKKLVEAQIQRIGEKLSSLSKRDRILVMVISAVSDLEKTLSSSAARLKEWFGLHYPEVMRQYRNPVTLAKRILEFGHRSAFPRFSGSSGMEFGPDDVAAVREYAELVVRTSAGIERLESYLKRLSEEVIPNLSALLGFKLASRLVAEAGSLEKLAKLPSSALQLLGAEKALFRHLRKKTRPPKHGIIFLHPDVSGAPKHLRGKVARLLSSKAVLAARADYYTGEIIHEELVSDYRKKLGELLEAEKDRR